MKPVLRGKDRAPFFLGTPGNDAGNMVVARRAFDFQIDAPPAHLMQYGETADRHLATGKQQAVQMRALLEQCGFSATAKTRFMDFGCANGRVLRWLRDWAETGEGWGVDINANPLIWCASHMSPPFHFAVTTTAPHLPFEQRYFDLVFCNSVFTHMDEMFYSWLQELRRVTAIGGYLFISILNEVSVAGMKDMPHSFFNTRFGDDPDVQNFGGSHVDLIALRRGKGLVTVVRSEYFESLLRPWFDTTLKLSSTVGGLQTGYLLRRQA